MPEQHLGEVRTSTTECAGGWAFLSGRKESFALSLAPLPIPHSAHYLEMQAQVSNVCRTHNSYRTVSGG